MKNEFTKDAIDAIKVLSKYPEIKILIDTSKTTLSSKQRKAIIEQRGEPILRLEFDVFKDNRVSMWTTFDHSSDFDEVKKQLIAIRDHLNEFLNDGNMCPFHK
jgi:hypothetical protein